MKFGTDKQTILDLNIFSKTKGELSIFNIYNSTITKGGRDALEQMMRIPLCNFEELNSRLSTIKYICNNGIKCRLENEYLDFIEYYLNQSTPVLKDNIFNSVSARISYKIKPSNEYYIIQTGLEYLKNHLAILSDFLKDIDKLEIPDFINQLLREIQSIKEDPELRQIINPDKGRFTFRQINHLDFTIRKNKKEIIKRVLKLTYELDAYLSVSHVSKKRKFGFPEITKESKPYLKISGLFHPFIDSPIKNDFNILDSKNLCFVTGANMAGKSTFLKAVGLCVYLSHLGFPVPASEMEISMFNGLFTTINISDDINRGYSHYYSEVRRVKEIALMIKEKKKVMVIFDELFRGTNVKDAFDATLMVSKGFTKIKDSLFCISTHIVEVGQELEKLESVDFKCFESHLEGEKPVYNYKLVNGISTERLGLTILKNENIMEIINQITND
jgi:DNA mismatch repair protein MutS